MKVVYINKETGKEVHYGDSITIKESGKFDNGYSYFSCGWVHCWNASNYMGKNIDKKMERIFCLLEEELF